MKRKIMLEIEASDIELAAARAAAEGSGEGTVKKMLRNFVKNELRNQVFDHRHRAPQPEPRQAVKGIAR